MIRIYRVQDSDGRGPFKPGFSHRWADAEDAPRPPTWAKEFGGWHVFDGQCGPGEHMGCGVRTLEALNAWFSPSEQLRLCAFGYRPVSMMVDGILAESAHQIIFMRRKPLRFGVRPQPWPAIALVMPA